MPFMDEGSSDYDVSPRLLEHRSFLNRARRRLRAALTRTPRLGDVLRVGPTNIEPQ